MRKERWIVERVTDAVTGETAELRGFASPERARDYARNYSAKNGIGTTVTWILENVDRNGREVIDAEVTDGFSPSGR